MAPMRVFVSRPLEEPSPPVEPPTPPSVPFPEVLGVTEVDTEIVAETDTVGVVETDAPWLRLAVGDGDTDAPRLRLAVGDDDTDATKLMPEVGVGVALTVGVLLSDGDEDAPVEGDAVGVAEGRGATSGQGKFAKHVTPLVDSALVALKEKHTGKRPGAPLAAVTLTHTL